MNRPFTFIPQVLASLTLAYSIFFPLTVQAFSKPLFQTEITRVSKTGSADRVIGSVRLTSQLAQPIKVRLAYLKTYSSAATNANLPQKANRAVRYSRLVSIRPNGRGLLPFQFALKDDGKRVVILMIEAYDKTGKQLIGRQTVDLYFLIRKGRYQRSTYNELYVPRDEIIPVSKVSRDAKIAPFPTKETIRHIDPRVLEDLTSQHIGRENNGFPTSISTLPAVDESSSLLSDAADSWLNGQDLMLKLLGIENAQAATGYFHVSGKFSFKGIANDFLQPAWQWEVELRGKKDNGESAILATANVDHNGNWYASFAEFGYSGQELLILYRMRNFYVSFEKNEAGTPYLWGHTFSDIPATLNIGHWYANTSESGTAFGVADAYANSMLYLGKSLMGGIDPIREQPIRVFIPNTWYNCGLDQEEPHSCARREGDDGAGWLWLAPKHMYTVIWLLVEPVDGVSIPPFLVSTEFVPYPKTLYHELAHHTHYEYWDNELPPYDSEPFIYDCGSAESKGRALVEGFADAVAFWHLHELDEPAPTEQSYTGNIESPEYICKNESELSLVAATLWDMMDTHVDDAAFDHMHFDKAEDVLLTFLEGGYHETMTGMKDNFVTAFGPAEPGSDQLHPVECVFTGNYMVAGTSSIAGQIAYGSVGHKTKYNEPGGCNY
jgi:hypothetical protein